MIDGKPRLKLQKAATMGPSCLLHSVLLLSVASISCSSSMTTFMAPHFPSHFTADVHILSHLITPDMQTDGYPPSSRHLHLSYNREHGGMARIDEGIISYIRRFDLKQEYKINSGPYPSCRTSYLSEMLPTHQFSRGGHWFNNGSPVQCPEPYTQQQCKTWHQDEGGGQIVKVYVSDTTSVPLVATVYATDPATLILEPTITFQWINIDLNPPNTDLFVDVSTQRQDCEDQAGGFPWIHLFHHFFKI